MNGIGASMRRAVLVAASTVAVAFPLFVWLSRGRLSPAVAGAVLIAVALLRWALSRAPRGLSHFAINASMASFGVALVLSGNFELVRWHPVVVNGVLLGFFGASLISPPTVVERLARLSNPNLPASGVRYTRNVTAVWCVFFVLNGSVAAATALWASFDTWSLYNGVVAYVLMGLLFSGEFWVRQRHLKRAAS